MDKQDNLILNMLISGRGQINSQTLLMLLDEINRQLKDALLIRRNILVMDEGQIGLGKSEYSLKMNKILEEHFNKYKLISKW